MPTAQMEEILPAARLLSRATSPTPSDYERAKALFLKGVQQAAIHAQVCPFCRVPDIIKVLVKGIALLTRRG